MQAARELAQLRVRGGQLLLGGLEQLLRRLGLAARDLEQVRDGEQPLLRAVVQVAPDAAALGVGGLDDPGARGLQGARLDPPLELGAGAGGEDLQHRDVLGLRPPSGARRARRGGRGRCCRSRAGRRRGSSPGPSRPRRGPRGSARPGPRGTTRASARARARTAGRRCRTRTAPRSARRRTSRRRPSRGCRSGRSPRRRARAWRRAPRRRCARGRAGTRRRPRRLCPPRRPAAARGRGGGLSRTSPPRRIISRGSPSPEARRRTHVYSASVDAVMSDCISA